MTPQQQLALMKFHLVLAKAIYYRIPRDESEDGLISTEILHNAELIVDELEKELAPAPEEPERVWALRHRSTHELYKDNRYREALYFTTQEDATNYARAVNMWKMLEPELVLVSEVRETYES